jgi:hypothetical protein
LDIIAKGIGVGGAIWYLVLRKASIRVAFGDALETEK